MLIGGLANLPQNVAKVALLGKCGELRSVIQPHIEKPLDAVSL
jgi:hypothetical protein